MKDEPAGRHANDRQRSAEIGAEQGKRISLTHRFSASCFMLGERSEVPADFAASRGKNSSEFAESRYRHR